MAKDNVPQKESGIFPNAVVECILSKLPVKSLVRFQQVSKSWERMISSPQFTIRRSKSEPQNLYLVWDKTPHSEIFSLMRLVDWDFKIDEPIYKFSPSIPLCSCNGVLLVKSLIDGDMHLCLLNPSVRSKTTILSQRASEDFAVNYGHYYDSRADDYIVVVISRKRCGEEDYSLYSCRNRVWSDKKPFPRRGGIEHENGLFVDGCFYWWVREEKRLVCFNAREGKVEEAGGPEKLRERDESEKVKVSEVTGRLCLYSKRRDWGKYRFWLMEKEEEERCFGVWRELMHFDGEEPPPDQPPLKNEDRVVFLTDGTLPRSKFLVCFEGEDESFEQLICDVSGKKRSYHNVIPFVETVLSPLRHYKSTVV